MSFTPNIEYVLIVMSGNRNVNTLHRIMATACLLHSSDLCAISLCQGFGNIIIAAFFSGFVSIVLFKTVGIRNNDNLFYVL